MESFKAIERISPEELDNGRLAASPPVIIDVLPKGRFDTVHIPGSVNACVFEVTFLDRAAAAAVDRDAPVVVYGAGGDTLDALVAADKLQRAGYLRVRALDGGLEAWIAAGLPVAGAPATDDLPPLADGEYVVDVEASRIQWAGRNPNTRHHGTVPLTVGRLSMRDGVAVGGFEIDLRRIRNLNLEGDPLQSVLEAHLMSDDFFFVERFPTARYRIRRGTAIPGAAASAPNYAVTGDLSLRGVEAPLDFEATVVPGPDGEVRAEAHFDFDRTRWGVIYGSRRFFRHLGMHLVFDHVSLQIDLVARKV